MTPEERLRACNRAGLQAAAWRAGYARPRPHGYLTPAGRAVAFAVVGALLLVLAAVVFVR